MANVLIYEPDQNHARKLCTLLQKGKHEPKLCDVNQNPAPVLMQNSQSLIVIDAQMKWTDCRPILEAAAEYRYPVLFLTDNAGMVEHLKALYSFESRIVVFPLSAAKLLNPIQELLETQNHKTDFQIDHQEKAAILDGKKVSLTAQEYALLSTLMDTPEEPVSREELLRKAWGYQSMGETRTVDVHVQRLRKKLGTELIETVYKYGYRLKLA